MRLLACIAVLPFVTQPFEASAHHSVAGLYDRGAVIEVEGVLTRVFWRNPHVRFWVTDTDGKTWEIETHALGLLERVGITSDLFAESAVVRIAGNPARTSDSAFYALNVLLPDGREALMRPGVTPRWSSRTLDFEERDPIPEAAASAARERADGIFRVWSSAGGQDWNVSLTDAAQAARSRWEPSRDDPTLRCIAPGMIEAMTSPYPLELTKDGEDIVIRMEEWDGVRRVHMRASGDASSSALPTPLGYSIGHWEGDTLVVATSRINWPYFDSRGTPQSADVAIVERFAISDDEQRMSWVAVITDPANLAEPAVVRQEYTWIPGEEIEPFDCTLPN